MIYVPHLTTCTTKNFLGSSRSRLLSLASAKPSASGDRLNSSGGWKVFAFLPFVLCGLSHEGVYAENNLILELFPFVSRRRCLVLAKLNDIWYTFFSVIFIMQTLIMEGSHFPPFFAMFSVLYFIGYCLLFRNWSPKHRPDATSCLISLFHGTPAVFLALSALLSNPNSGFSSKNSKSQNLVLDFSIAYFTVDLLHYLVLLPGDVLFIAHHLATLFVFCTCRYLVYHGAFAILVLLVLAEVTSACQNIWTLAGLKRVELALAANVYSILSTPFYVVYSIMRVILGPLFFLKMSIYYLSGEADDVIPRWVSVSWIVVVGGAILVSILWISNLWLELVREKKGVSDKKER